MRHFILSSFILIVYQLSFSQNFKPDYGHVTGIVQTADNQPAEFIQVYIQNTGFGTITDGKGRFAFDAPAGKCTLVIQSIFCHRREIEIIIPNNGTLEVPLIQIIENKRQLGEVVITGQFEAQSVRNSVYRVRSISPEKISSKGAMDLKAILETEPGIRFSNDLATGETDIQLMGMSGQNVKILVDGTPMIDRGATRQSLSQIDINNIERIEIVEGPMSVVYGTDALAGVINIITKKNKPAQERKLSVAARVQEETVGDEYEPFQGKGKHNNHIGINYRARSGWHVGSNFTRNDFGGWQGSFTGRAKQWKEKNQLLGQTGFGLNKENYNFWYRLNWLDEIIKGDGNVNPFTNIATDKDFNTIRFTHQLQGNINYGNKWSFNMVFSYQDYERATQTTTYNVVTKDRRLSLGAGEQDVSEFDNIFGRGTTLYKLSRNLNLQWGLEYRNDKANGARIKGTPTISDYSTFLSAELKIGEKIQLRPGIRLTKNSTYDAPPVIPSLNTKWAISDKFDLRLSYARGFRAPALRELYFWFFDASHSIKGNLDLKAEYSDSYTGSFTFRPVHAENLRVTTTLSPFYNRFNNLITTARDAVDPTITTYINIDKFKTTGAIFDVACNTGNWQITAGVSYIARYNKHSQSDARDGDKSNEFEWSPEASLGILYTYPKWGTDINIAYKHTGRRPFHELVTNNSVTTVRKAYIGEFNWADITVNQKLYKKLKLQARTVSSWLLIR